LKRLKASVGAALFGATIFQLGGYFASQAQHLGAMCGAAWLPLAWMSLLDLSERLSLRPLAWLSIAFAMSVLAGFPATAIVVIGSTVGLAVLLVATRNAPFKALAFVASAGAWAALLSAIQSVPTFNLSALSTAALRPQWHLTGGVSPRALVSLVWPNYYGVFDPALYSLPFNFTFIYVYCGILGLILALAGIALARTRMHIAFALLTLLCCVWMLGSNTPLIGQYYRAIPDFIRGPMYAEFAMAAFTLGVAVMATFGAERFVRPLGSRALALLVFITAIDLTLVGSGRVMNTFRTIDDPAVGQTHFEGSEAALQVLRKLSHRSFPPARFDVIDASRNWATSANVIKVPTANGDEPLALLRTLKLRACFAEGADWERFYRVSRVDSPLLDLLNVRYLLASGPQALPQDAPAMAAVGYAGKAVVFENPGVLPRFFLVNRVQAADSFSESLEAVCSPQFDPRTTAIVETSEERVPIPGKIEGATVHVIAYTPEFIELEVESPAPSFLVTAETWYPGWTAYINGHDAEILITNVAFRGMAVPAGRSQIMMRFRPRDFYAAAAVTVVACLLTGFAVWKKRTTAP
jgi:hypothetical protein